MNFKRAASIGGLLWLGANLQAQVPQNPPIQYRAVSIPASTPQQIRDTENYGPPNQTPLAVYNMSPTLTLIPHSPNAHPGQIWIRTAEDGLHVWGA